MQSAITWLCSNGRFQKFMENLSLNYTVLSYYLQRSRSRTVLMTVDGVKHSYWQLERRPYAYLANFKLSTKRGILCGSCQAVHLHMMYFNRISLILPLFPWSLFRSFPAAWLHGDNRSRRILMISRSVKFNLLVPFLYDEIWYGKLARSKLKPSELYLRAGKSSLPSCWPKKKKGPVDTTEDERCDARFCQEIIARVCWKWCSTNRYRYAWEIAALMFL